MDLLEESLPGRTSHEIANLIHIYKQRGKRQITQHESSSKQQGEEENSTCSSSNSSNRPVCAKNSPISQWSQLLGHIIHPRNKRDDLSETLITVFEGYSNSNDNHDNQNNNNNANGDGRKYSSIYEFLSDCLQGKCPRELDPQNSLIILSLLKQAKLFLHYVGCDVERKFLQNSRQNESQSKECEEGEEVTCISEQNELHEEETRRSQLTCSGDGSIECRLSDPVTESSLRSRLDHFVETCMDLPKMKKIKSCLNPLNVPASMTVEEANCLLEAIEDSS